MSAAVGLDVLERNVERARIESLLDAVTNGRGAVLAIEGDAGIGKSTLLRLARDHAERRGMTTRMARCVDSEVTYPLAAVAQLVGAEAPDIPLGEPLPAAGEYRVFEAVHRSIALKADAAPVALLVDDVQWSDPESLRCLAYLAHRIDPIPVALIVTAGTDESPSDAHVLQGLLADPSVELLSPPPLSAEAVRALIALRLEQEPHDRFVDACLGATRGNPFLVVELLRELAVERIAPDAETAAGVAELGPRAVARSALLRVGRFGAAAVEIARAVAVLGDGCDPGHAAALAGVTAEAADAAADGLSGAGILWADSGFGFVHPLVAAAIRTDLGPSQKHSLHARAAELLARSENDVDAVAHHLRRTRPARNRATVDVLRRAAHNAMERGAPEVAAKLLKRALDEGAEDTPFPALQRELGDARLRLGHQGAERAYSDALAGTECPIEQAAIARQIASSLIAHGNTAEAMRVLEQALRRIGPRDVGLALELQAEIVTAASVEPERLRDLRPGGATASSDSTSSRLCIAATAVRAFFDGAPAMEVADLAEQALGDGRLLAEQTPEGPALHLCGFALVQSERYDVAAGAIDTALADARRRGSVVGQAFSLGGLAHVNLACGRLPAAERHARAALEMVRRVGIEQAIPGPANHLATVLLDARGAEAAWQVLENLELTSELPETVFHSRLLEARGRVHIAAGRPVEALADLEELGDRSRRLALGPTRWRSEAALASAALGDAAAARLLAEEAGVAARAFGAPREVGVALRALGLVTAGAAGIRLLEEAVAVLEGSRARLELARALIDLGAAKRRAGLRTDARGPLQHGQAIAASGGAGALAARAADELAASGIRLRAGGASREGLTPAERRVAELAAAGRPNRAIAGELYLSLKTVEVHLTSAYRKLGIRSRRDLAEALAVIAPPRRDP